VAAAPFAAFLSRFFRARRACLRCEKSEKNGKSQVVVVNNKKSAEKIDEVSAHGKVVTGSGTQRKIW
jgi:hypothetical protein